ncbi:MAG TPA: dipeptide/oligopeptide/nickel ABC transporter ATP-binding protein [Pseudothermotoga sp.]|uniref:ABC transporter ATP-binding protein n=1 Tax=Pseudothermotoga lettingae TaxID=177758 RepID=UPI00074A9A30|nr:oligopeptide/dipeptide ABC transporter ATP-binding protein [Pseudothermotoga lettingae]KUK21180.1 MAG: Oligopeptide/dipeptide ABC transporter, ATPase subunit [Pseudothermotoga lettingae]HBT26479.1 dipeptide/oligopeptide/nickel ABC transporter ATP-binding protein [Pseudothermotoga sp.]
MIEVVNLRKYFLVRSSGIWGRKKILRAVDGISFSTKIGETLAIVGESGSGKSTLVRCINGLVQPTSGEIYLDGVKVNGLKGEQYRQKVSRKIQMVFQDPVTSLNPRMRVLEIVSEPLMVHTRFSSIDRKGMVLELLERVGLNEKHMYKYPGELSGGQCQRVAIARALSIKPGALILDEPTASLDVSVQAQVIDLLMQLQNELDLTYLFVSHDISVVRSISHRTMVMYLGKVMELGPTEEVIDNPLHPYTEILISSIFVPDPNIPLFRPRVQGEPSDPVELLSGCLFRTRCPIAENICSKHDMSLKQVKDNRFSACWKS